MQWPIRRPWQLVLFEQTARRLSDAASSRFKKSNNIWIFGSDAASTLKDANFLEMDSFQKFQ